jgi:hypothetical protein
MVIVDRLSKEVIIIPTENIETTIVVHKFIEYFIRNHGLLNKLSKRLQDDWSQ